MSLTRIPRSSYPGLLQAPLIAQKTPPITTPLPTERKDIMPETVQEITEVVESKTRFSRKALVVVASAVAVVAAAGVIYVKFVSSDTEESDDTLDADVPTDV